MKFANFVKQVANVQKTYKNDNACHSKAKSANDKIMVSQGLKWKDFQLLAVLVRNVL